MIVFGLLIASPFIVGGSSADAAVRVRGYLTVAEADGLAAALPGLAAWSAAATLAKARAVEQASDDVDAAGPYQGRRYDAAQEHEFPRAAYESRLPAQYPHSTGRGGLADTIWDWDESTQTAVVPLNVKRAVLLQANAILDGSRDRLLEAQQSGLASQSVGGLSESYRNMGAAPVDGLAVLTIRAAQLMAKYRLRSGRLL